MKNHNHSISARASLRLVAAISICTAGLLLGFAGVAQSQTKGAGKRADRWPSLETQLTQQYNGRNVEAGSALEQLIRDNQDFSLLRQEEATDKRGLPPWLRVWWRKAHPEAKYDAEDPTGGYPHVLKEILEWMMTHQDLKPGPGVEEKRADIDASTSGDFRISGAQTGSRSESDIRVNFFDASKILSASNNISGTGQQGVYYSTNAGTTWANSELPLITGDSFHSDPTVDWTNDGRAWSSTLGINSGGSVLKLRNYFSADNGATWTLDATPSGAQTNVDKQMVWVDHSSASPYFGQMYAIWHNGSPAYINRRTAGAGGTWLAAPIQVSGAESSGTCIGADVKTNSAGDVFGAWPTTTSRKIFVVKSTNGGASFGAPVQIAATYDGYDIGVPAFNSRRALVYVTLGAYRNGAKNNVYATWTDLSGDSGCTAAANEPGSNAASSCKTRIWFARSTDGGATWSTPIRINHQASLNDQFNQWLAVDETSGGIAITYYDTVGDSARKKTDVWYQSSADDGATWSPPLKITSAMTDETISGADSGNQYGDYNSLSGYASLFFPSWTDRRSGAKEEIWSAKITDTFAPSANVSGAGTQIITGTCSNLPPSTLNPGQSATVNLCISNTGNLAVNSNVTGALQTSGGVVNPSGPQNYGTLPAGGPAVCRAFTFTPTVACGSNVTMTLQLSDGTNSYGPVVYTFKTGVLSTSLFENFDSVTAPALPSGWVASNATGAAPLWVTSTSTPDTAPNAAFVDDPATISDKQLVSANLYLASAATQIVIRHNYTLESGFDGGVIEVSSPNVNAGAFTDIANAATGASFASGGYNGTISGSYSNPLASRSAFTGSSGGYTSSVINVGSLLAGQTVKLRFRMGSDSSVAGTGWRVDGISLNNGYVCAPLPVTAVSRKTHGNAGDFDVALPIAGTPGIEPRSGGANGDHQIVLTFANPITASNAAISAGVGSVANLSVNGSQAVVNITGLTNTQTSVVTVNGLNDGTSSGCVNIPISALLGDSNGDGSVNSGDSIQVRNRAGTSLDQTNFRSDVNADGMVNSGDSIIVRNASGTALSP